MKDGIIFVFLYKHPKDIAIYMYKYLKWCYYNYDSLTYSIFFKAIISLVIPYWVHLKISKINLGKLFSFLFKYIYSMFKKDKKENFELDDISDSNITQIDLRKEIYNIKKNTMVEIEESVNRMISEILCVRSKKNHNNINNNKS